MSKVLIIGFGTVGHNLAEELAPLHPDIYDKYKPGHNTRDPYGGYDVAFICVDTPYISGQRVRHQRGGKRHPGE